VTSLSAGVLQSFRRELPSIPSGLIVSVSIGSLHQIDADLFSLEARLATDAFLTSARVANKPVHVWGVRDVDQFTRLALRGVDGVIAADVRPFRQRLAELAEMDDAERLLLAFRVRLLE
jgi:glycerophosphoryl diester phosphodiesterase